MIEKILVPLDGSMNAERVLPHVRRILYRNDSEVILVRAAVPAMIEDSGIVNEAALGAAREYLAGAADRLSRQGVRVQYVVRLGSAAGVILDVAVGKKATLIAMATHGETGLKRALFGSVAEAVIRKTPVPVLAVRPFWSYDVLPRKTDNPEVRPIRNVLLPVDGSPLAEAIVEPITEFAGLFDSRVVLLRVIEPVRPKKGTLPIADKPLAKKALQPFAKEIEKRGVETLTLVEKGDPTDEILKATRLHDIDLIAMTTHGRSGLSRLVTGSVTESVLREATVPVLIVRSLKQGKAKKSLATAGKTKK